MKLIDITKGSEHDLSLFSEEKIAELESHIVIKEKKRGLFPLSLQINELRNLYPFIHPKNLIDRNAKLYSK